jgi:hypothetical protein
MQSKQTYSNEIKVVPIKEINSRLGSKSDLYRKLAKRFYLPKIDSKATTIEYLQKYFLAGPPILKLERNAMQFIDLSHLKGQFNIEELMLRFDEYLKKKKLPPLGMEEGYTPDLEWIIRAIKHCDPHDELRLFVKGENIENSVTRTFDKE